MLHRLSTDTLNWIIIAGVILFIIEIAFFHGGMIFTAVITGFLIYLGRKNYSHLWGKVFFWIGVIGFVLSVLNMMAVRFWVIVGIILFVIDYAKSNKGLKQIQPVIDVNINKNRESIVRTKPLFNYKLYGSQSTKNNVYEWNDINIHGGIGDREIDLTLTVLPHDTAVISIRHLIGNIIICVPYDVEISIHHSSVFGRAHILGKHHLNMMNQTLSYETEHYAETYQRVKIITSIFSGDIEVRRK